MNKFSYAKKYFFYFVVFAKLIASSAMAGELNIDVMSFNIRYGTAEDGQNHWDARKSLVFDVIRDSAPDIIGLQESLRFQIDEIRDNVPGYEEIGEGKLGGELGEYSAILYRYDRFYADKSGTFWLSESPEVPSKHWGNTTMAICTWVRLVDRKSKKTFYIYNTHLDYLSLPSRVRSVRLISDHITYREYKDPFVLMGDFNAGEDSPTVRYLKGENVGKPVWPMLMDEGLKWLHFPIRYLNRFIRSEVTSLPVIDTFRVLHPDRKKVGTRNRFNGKIDEKKWTIYLCHQVPRYWVQIFCELKKTEDIRPITTLLRHV